MKRLLSLYILIMCSVCVVAQNDRQMIRKGNRLYRQQKYDKAEVDYRKAASLNQKNPQALYNLGCALMSQQKDSAAIVQFQAAGKLETNKMRKSKVYHNIGVICQGHQMYGEAIEAYKESLRNNPKDMETRYNLALCQRQQKNQKNNDKNKNQQNKQNQDKDKNGKDQKKDQNQQQDKKDQNQKNQQQKEQMSKDNAEQLLQAAEQSEKNTQQKMKKEQAKPRDRKLEKNW